LRQGIVEGRLKRLLGQSVSVWKLEIDFRVIAMTDVGSVHYDRWGYLPEKRAAMTEWTNWLTLKLGG